MEPQLKTDEETNLSEDKLQRYVVFVDDNFHYMDESERYRHGDFQTYEHAERACKSIIDAFLADQIQATSKITASELMKIYVAFGEDPFVIPNDGKFSAWEYAKKRSVELCG